MKDAQAVCNLDAPMDYARGMRAATSESPKSPLHVANLPSRALRPGEIRVATRAIGVNPVDWKMKEGTGPLRLAHRFVGPSGPFVCGVDFAGEVTELGPGVTGVAVGERVVGGTDFSRRQLGSYADEVVVRPDQVAKLPEAVSFEQAACLPIPFATAHRALVEIGRVGGGSKVLVLGASGGVGLACIQLARNLGATVVGVCSARNQPLVERLGARAIDYGAGDAVEAAAAHGPFDLAVNAVGTASYPTARVRALLAAGSGALVIVDVKPKDALAVAFLPRVHAVLGRPSRRNLEPAVASVADGRFECVVHARMPLEEAERAHDLSRSGKVVGKVLLVP